MAFDNQTLSKIKYWQRRSYEAAQKAREMRISYPEYYSINYHNCWSLEALECYRNIVRYRGF